MTGRLTIAALALVAMTLPASANGKTYQRYVGVEALPMYESVRYERQPIIAFSLGGLGFYEPYSYGLDYYGDDDYYPLFRGHRFHRHHHFGGHRFHHRGGFGGHHRGHHRGGHRGHR